MTTDRLKDRIKHLASRKTGLSRQDGSTKFNMSVRAEVRTLMDSMEATGELIGVFHPMQRGCGKKTRLFLTQADAQAWMAEPLPGYGKGERSKRQGVVVRAARQPLPEQAPREQSVPIITSETKVTICKGATVDRRYQVEPGSTVIGCGFAKLKPGQYIAEASSLAAKALAA